MLGDGSSPAALERCVQGIAGIPPEVGEGTGVSVEVGVKLDVAVGVEVGPLIGDAVDVGVAVTDGTGVFVGVCVGVSAKKGNRKRDGKKPSIIRTRIPSKPTRRRIHKRMVRRVAEIRERSLNVTSIAI